MALQLVITNAGRAAVIDQANGGFRAVRIAAVGVSPTPITAAPAASNLPDEVKRIGTIAGEATAADVTHLTVTDESNASYFVRSFALYLSDGTLFALYGQTDPIVQKSAQALLLLAIDVVLSDIPAASITFGNANFINPAATTERAGVAELATLAEVAAGTDAQRIVSPATAAKIYAALAGASFTGTVSVGRPTTGQVALSQSANTANTGYIEFNRASGAREGYIGFAPTGGAIQMMSENGAGFSIAGGPLLHGGAIVWDAANDGAGSGLDADLLDGRHAADFALLSGAAFSGTVSVGTSATGQVSLSQSANTSNTGYIEFKRASGAREGYIGFAPTGGQIYLNSENGAGFNIAGGPLTRDGNRVWDAANDGAGSGLDADLLDGRQATEFALLSGADFTGKATFAASVGIGVTNPYSPLHVRRADQSEARITVENVAAGGRAWQLVAGVHGISQGDFSIFDASAGATRLTIDTAGVVRFAGALAWTSANDGAGSGLDADLLDGRNASEFALLSGADFSGPIAVRTPDGGTSGGIKLVASPASGAAYFQVLDWTGNVQWGLFGFGASGLIRWNDNTIWHAGNDGAGSTLDADLVDGWHRDEIRDWNNQLNRPASIWHAANDGAGSGLDADLVDGWHRDDIRDWGNILNKPAAFPVAAHTHGASDIAGAFPGTLSANGYVILPNGLILQWVTGAQQAASSEGTQYVAFPIAFNTVFQVIVSTQVANANIESHAIYQLISNTTEGATVMRQLVSSSGADREPSWPRLFAIGR